MDLAGGRYADYDEEWLFDGQPSSPYRRSISRRDITGAAVTGAATQVPYVVAVPAQVGDVFNFVSFAIGTLAGTAGNSSFVVVYSGMPSASNNVTVLGVSAATTFVAGNNKIALTSQVALTPTIGTPQNAVAATLGSGPLVLGVAIVEAWTTTGSQFDCASGAKAAFKGIVGAQIPLATTLPTLGGTPPAVGSLSGTTITAPSTGVLPYVVLSRS
ncbi:MAG TPA: hypothetical protein VGL02_28140 [Streptomyces sp.]